MDWPFCLFFCIRHVIVVEATDLIDSASETLMILFLSSWNAKSLAVNALMTVVPEG